MRELSYQRVATLLRRQILEQACPGDSLPAESQLAAEFGVSLITIRRALGLIAEGGWLRRSAGQGTFVQDPAVHKPIAILVEQDIVEPEPAAYCLRVATTVRVMLEERGHRTRFYFGYIPAGKCPNPLTNKDLLLDAEAGQLGGVLVVSGTAYAKWTDPLRLLGIPVVGFDGEHQMRVRLDKDSMLEHVFSILEMIGKQRVAYLGWDGFDGDKPDFPRSIKFRKLCDLRGYTIRNSWICSDLPPDADGAGWEAFREIWSSAERPEVIVVQDSIMAREVQDAVIELGIKVSEQLQVIVMTTDVMMREIKIPAYLLYYKMADLGNALCDMFTSIRFGTSGFRDYMKGQVVHEFMLDKYYVQAPKAALHRGGSVSAELQWKTSEAPR